MKGKTCDDGLGKFDGVCRPCGGVDQVACPAIERGRRCLPGLDFDKGRCRACGGEGERACPVAMKGRTCDDGLGKFDGVCRACGGMNEPACPAIEHGRQCEEWTTSVGKRCKPCGGTGQVACKITDKGRSCKPGLSRHSGRCVRGSSFREKYLANKSNYEPRHRSLMHDLASVKGAATTPSSPPPASANAIDRDDLEGWVFQAATDEDKRALMVRRLEQEDVDVVTLVSGGGGAVVAGYTHSYGYAMMKDYSTPEDGSDYTCRKIKGNVFTGGVALGGGLFAELGDWSGDFDTLHGWSNGWQLAASVLVAGWGKGAHWSADEGGSDGVTVMAGAGLGLDVAGEYARSHTKVKDEIACGNMEW